jgi:TrpR-related protein YerC/YecD
MSQVSKYPLKQKVFEKMFELLSKAIINSNNKEEVESLLDDLLTPTEKIMLAKRLAIAVLLTKGYFYKTIQEIIRVSTPTIAMVSLSLKYKGKGFKSFTSQILKEEKSNEFWDKIEDLVLGTLSNVKGGKPYRYLKEELRKNKQRQKTPL